jgi:hypothetical protein
MATRPRRSRTARAGSKTSHPEETTPRKKAGRPPGPPSTIINLRIPIALVARLDQYIDSLEAHTGLKAHRGMIARRALELFLETHEPGYVTLPIQRRNFCTFSGAECHFADSAACILHLR